jgi:hypothetical protein
MGRKIYCAGCSNYLGEIKDARLRKNISYLCSTCESARKLMEKAKNNRNTDSLREVLGDIFNR